MVALDDYRTGNKKLDEQIAKSVAKYPHRTTRLHDILHLKDSVKQADIQVSDKDLRTYKDGTLFASKGEMDRWDYLLNIQLAGEIKDLRRQVVFVLQEEFINRQWGEIHELIYVSDFMYYNISFRKECPDRECVEDSKGGRLTDMYLIKRKLFLYKYAQYLFFEV